MFRFSSSDIEDFIQADTEIPKLFTTTELAENYNIYARKILRKVHVCLEIIRIY